VSCYDRGVISAAIWQQIGARARGAADRREITFALPELQDVASWVAATTPDAGIREDAACWSPSGAAYHALVRLCARAVLALDGLSEASAGAYREKVAGELEPMLALWPDVIVFPCTAPLAPLDLIALRAFPVHPLGLVDRPTWTDGARGSPSEFFFHDLDHARFKVREDLQAEGIEIPDAYAGGSTLDGNTGRHRLIMAHAAGRIGGRLWARAASRWGLARRLREGLADLGNGPVREAAELLLFEIVHEKSCSLDSQVLLRELTSDAHLSKLRVKALSRFFPGGTEPRVVDALPRAGAALREMLT
jgi:hypothetical protein